jgi:hypothetical protein
MTPILREFRDERNGYDYVTTVEGNKCTARTGIDAGIQVNVSSVDAAGIASIWTESPITGPYTDTVPFNTLRRHVKAEVLK